MAERFPLFFLFSGLNRVTLWRSCKLYSWPAWWPGAGLTAPCQWLSSTRWPQRGHDAPGAEAEKGKDCLPGPAGLVHPAIGRIKFLSWSRACKKQCRYSWHWGIAAETRRQSQISSILLQPVETLVLIAQTPSKLKKKQPNQLPGWLPAVSWQFKVPEASAETRGFAGFCYILPA